MRRIILACAFGAMSACAHAGSVTRSAPARHILTAVEIASAKATSAYQAIKRLRPEFLHVRGSTSVRNPVHQDIDVYVDGMRIGGIGELRHIPAAEVQEIRYLSAWDATTRYGSNHLNGVIAVTTILGR